MGQSIGNSQPFDYVIKHRRLEAQTLWVTELQSLLDLKFEVQTSARNVGISFFEFQNSFAYLSLHSWATAVADSQNF